MRRFDAGCTGAPPGPNGAENVTGIPHRWSPIIQKLTRGCDLRPVQRQALEQARILESRQHLVVCAPTNSGKSLLGYLILMDAVLQGRRAILLEPLRALAQEQADELTELVASLKPSVLERIPKVRISTGDYRREGELPSAPPPAEGEIIVATPERLDAILRNPANSAWLSGTGSLVVDEAHLIGDAKRGPTLELAIASLLSTPLPPRVALLSATMGEPDRLGRWLHPCQVITSTSRTPLTKEVWQLDEGEQADDVLATTLRRLFLEPTSAALTFVYRRDAAEALARKLSIELNLPVASYHSGQSAVERSRTRADFLSGSCRCLVATTALGMGVNLPATHVFIRDTTFFGFGGLTTREFLQILGRAGRGDRAGVGVVLLRPRDAWDARELALALSKEVLPPLKSAFDQAATGNDSGDEIALSAATLVATCLGRAAEDGLNSKAISAILESTLGGRSLAPRVDTALRWLTDPSRVLAYRDQWERFHLTVLGKAGVRTMLPLPYTAGVGQLVRDLISLDHDAKLLGRWSALDHLFVAALLSDRAPKLRRFSEALANQIDGWLESRPAEGKSFLFAEWVMGTPEATRADELWGSLGMKATSAVTIRKKAYVAMLAAIILDERSRGTCISDLERRWGMSGLDGLEESWRDNVLWLLAGHAALFEVRAFYHHLRENCSASARQIRSIKNAVSAMRHQAYDLLEGLKYCSPLGVVVRGIRDLRRNGTPTIGIGTIRKLEAAGAVSLQQIAAMNFEALVAAGIQKRFARQIHAYVRRRLK